MTMETLGGVLLGGGLAGIGMGLTIDKNGKVKPISMAEQIKAYKPEFLQGVEIDCSVAHSDEEMKHEGEFIFIRNASEPTVDVDIRLNEPDNPKVRITELKQIIGPFYRFFVTNDAGIGTLKLIVGRGYGFRTHEDVVQGVYLQQEWAAKKGISKHLSTYGTGKTWGTAVTVTYDVPAGKTLYIVQFSGSAHGHNDATADNNQIVHGFMQNSTHGTNKIYVGGNGGFSVTLPTPVKIPENETFFARAQAFANHQMYLYVSALGYEV